MFSDPVSSFSSVLLILSSSGCTYVCVCIYVCVYVCMYVYVYMCICMYVFMYICLYVFVYVCMCVCVCMCVFWKYVCIYLCMYYVRDWIQNFPDSRCKTIKLTIRSIGCRHPRSTSLPHVDNGPLSPLFLERILEVFSVKVSSTLFVSAWMSLMVSNRRPFSLNFILRNKKKSLGTTWG